MYYMDVLFGAGWMSDTTASYDPAFYGCGVLICLSGVMMFIAPCLAPCDCSATPKSVQPILPHPAVANDGAKRTDLRKKDRFGWLIIWCIPKKWRTPDRLDRQAGSLQSQLTKHDICVTGNAETGTILATELAKV